MPRQTIYRVRNFERLQHYKNDRNNPWIRLYVRLLDDYDIQTLEPAARWLYVAMLLYANSTDNRVPADHSRLAWRFRMDPVDIETYLAALEERNLIYKTDVDAPEGPLEDH